MKNFDSSFCLLYICHFDESIAFGFMSISVVDDFNASYCADALEEFFEFIFSCVVRQVAEIESVRIDRGRGRGSSGRARYFCYPRAGFRRLPGLTLALFRGVATSTFAGRPDRFLVKADLLQELLPPS